MSERVCEALSQEEVSALLAAISSESAPVLSVAQGRDADRRREILQGVADHIPLLSFPEFQRTIAEFDNALAESLVPTRIPLSHILNLSDPVIQSLLRGLDDQWIALALQTANQSIRDRVLKNVSTRRHAAIEAELLKLSSQPDPLLGGWAEDELLGPLRKAFLDGVLLQRSDSSNGC